MGANFANGTELIDVMKLRTLLERLISGNAELSMINEQLDESFTPEESEEEYETALGYSEKATDQITVICRNIARLEQTPVSPTANSEAVEAAWLEVSALALQQSFSSTSGLQLLRLELPCRQSKSSSTFEEISPVK